MTTATSPTLPTTQLDWIAERLRIVNKVGEKILLEPNREQLQLLKVMAQQRAAGFPVRVIVLKARQVGISTQSDGLLFERTLHNPNHRALICAHNDKSSTTLFSMVKRFYENLPPSEQLPAKYNSRKEIAFASPHDSLIEVQTAGRMELGRGETIHYLHCSEVAFWPNAEKTLLAVMQTVSKQYLDSIVILESTANGIGGAFYDRWQQATKRMRADATDFDGFIPLFFSWLDHPAYRQVLPSNKKLGELDDDERGLKAIGATPQQLYWRRGVIAEACGGDIDMFKQEYPSTPAEAFRSTGRPAVPANIIAHYRKAALSGMRVRLDLHDDDTVTATATENEPYWEVWREPKDSHNYAVAGDVAEGQLSDPDNRASKPDFSVGVVLDRGRLEIAARYRGRPEPDVFGKELLKAAIWYNEAWVTPEVNSCGFGALATLKAADYPFVYYRQQGEDFLVPEELRQLGHKTTPQNRNFMIDEWLSMIRPDWQGSFDGRLVCYSATFADEMDSFVRDKNGKRQHRAGYFDDEIFATMIVLWIHNRTPGFSSNPETVRSPDRPAYLYVGGTDAGVVEMYEKLLGDEHL